MMHWLCMKSAGRLSPTSRGGAGVWGGLRLAWEEQVRGSWAEALQASSFRPDSSATPEPLPELCQ